MANSMTHPIAADIHKAATWSIVLSLGRRHCRALC
jgi:hypothetical protein